MRYARHLACDAHQIRRLTYANLQELLRNYADRCAILILDQPLRGCPCIRNFTFYRILPLRPIQNRPHCVITMGIGLKLVINSQFLKHLVFNQNVTNPLELQDLKANALQIPRMHVKYRNWRHTPIQLLMHRITCKTGNYLELLNSTVSYRNLCNCCQLRIGVDEPINGSLLIRPLNAKQLKRKES